MGAGRKMVHIKRILFSSQVKFVIDSNEHQEYGSTREKLTFALRECCLLLLCATVVLTATHE